MQIFYFDLFFHYDWFRAFIVWEQLFNIIQLTWYVITTPQDDTAQIQQNSRVEITMKQQNKCTVTAIIEKTLA